MIWAKFDFLPKIQLVNFSIFDFLPKFQIVNSTFWQYLIRRSDNRQIRHYSASPLWMVSDNAIWSMQEISLRPGSSWRLKHRKREERSEKVKLRWLWLWRWGGVGAAKRSKCEGEGKKGRQMKNRGAGERENWLNSDRNDSNNDLCAISAGKREPIEDENVLEKSLG